MVEELGRKLAAVILSFTGNSDLAASVLVPREAPEQRCGLSLLPDGVLRLEYVGPLEEVLIRARRLGVSAKMCSLTRQLSLHHALVSSEKQHGKSFFGRSSAEEPASDAT